MSNATVDNSVFAKATINSLLLERSKIQSSDFGKVVSLQVNFKGAIVNDTEFVEATLQGGQFDQAQIHSAHFQNSNLILSSFQNATLSQVNFADGNLAGAVFNNAKLIGVDFSRAYLNYASFLGTTIAAEDLSRFKGSSWWLAKGWTSDQLRKLVKNFPREDFVSSPRFTLLMKDFLTKIDKSKDDQTRAWNENSFAWFLAICGEDLITAEKYAKSAVQIAKDQLLQERDSTRWRKLSRDYSADLDTLAYILMQENRLSEAQSDLEEAVTIDENAGAAADPETYYKYAIVLRKGGQNELALKMENLSTKGKYTPTHELLLLPQLLGQLAGGDASVSGR
jgi:tetratricopeptide (TPR) repeat protein